MGKKSLSIMSVVLAFWALGSTLILQWITASGAEITIESSDVNNTNSAAVAWITNNFQLTKFLPTLAIIFSWFLILNFIMGIFKKK